MAHVRFLTINNIQQYTNSMRQSNPKQQHSSTTKTTTMDTCPISAVSALVAGLSGASKSSSYVSYEEEIGELLGCLRSGQQVHIMPRCTPHRKQLIEIYTLTDRYTLVKYRIARSRLAASRTNKQSSNITANSSSSSANKLFVIDGQLCANCIIVSMMSGHKINIKLRVQKLEKDSTSKEHHRKTNSRQLKHQQQQQQQQQKQYQQEQHRQQQQQHRQMNVYPDTHKYIRQTYQSNPQTHPYPQSQPQTVRPFSKLCQLSLQLNNQNICPQTWVQALHIMLCVLQFMVRIPMPALQTLYIRIIDTCNYGSNYVLSRINECIHNILHTKIGRGKDGCFPRLTALAINPMLYVHYIQQSEHSKDTGNTGHNQHIEDVQHIEASRIKQGNVPPSQKNNTAKDHKQQNIDAGIDADIDADMDEQTPITKLILVSLTPQINKQTTFNKLLTQMFPCVPKLTHLILHMQPETPFLYFNQLCLQLHPYCPLLQSLHIFDNNPHIDKQMGLRSILQHYPYLSDIKIKLYPQFDRSTNAPNLQFGRQWEYIKQIQFRRIHIQRSINIIKILEKKGYDYYTCMGVLEFMKPLRFPSFAR